jgi:hypothetical protein
MAYWHPKLGGEAMKSRSLQTGTAPGKLTLTVAAE